MIIKYLKFIMIAGLMANLSTFGVAANIQQELSDAIAGSELEQVKQILNSSSYKNVDINAAGRFGTLLGLAINSMKAILAFARPLNEGDVVPQKRKDDVVAGIAIIDELLHHGAKVSGDDWVLAGQIKSVDVMKKLYPFMKDINATNKMGNTILMEAINVFNLEGIKYLLKLPIDVNVKNNKGNSALASAIKLSYNIENPAEFLPVIESLLKHGAVIDDHIEQIAEDPFAGSMMEGQAISQSQKDSIKALLVKYKKK